MLEVVEKPYNNEGLWLTFGQDGIDRCVTYMEANRKPDDRFELYWRGNTDPNQVLSLFNSVLDEMRLAGGVQAGCVQLVQFGPFDAKENHIWVGDYIADPSKTQGLVDKETQFIRIEYTPTGRKSSSGEMGIWARVDGLPDVSNKSEVWEKIGVFMPPCVFQRNTGRIEEFFDATTFHPVRPDDFRQLVVPKIEKMLLAFEKR